MYTAAAVPERDRMKRGLVNLAFFFCFMPFFKVVNISAETQPIAGIISLFIILLYGVKRSFLSWTILFFIALVFLYTGITATIYPSFLLKILLNGFAYFLPLFVFLALHDKVTLVSPRAFYIVFWVWLIVGIIQYFSVLSPIRSVLDALFKYIIARYIGYAAGGGRGVQFLSPEPSAAATSIFLLGVTGVFLYVHNRINKRQFVIIVLGFLIMVFVNKSGTMMLLTLFFIGVYVLVHLRTLYREHLLLRRIARYTLLALLVGAVGYIALSILFSHKYHSRFGQIIGLTYQAIFVQHLLTLDDMIRIGGFRYLTLYIGYASIFTNYGIGHGIASWLINFPKLEADTHMVLYNYALLGAQRYTQFVKPGSYLATVSADMGGPGALVVVTFLVAFFASSWGKNRLVGLNALKYALLWSAVLNVLMMGLITLPMPWVLLCYVYYMNENAEYQESRGQIVRVRRISI